MTDTAAADPSLSSLARTPLYDLHAELGARMVPFAGYAMPVQYPSGVLKEHLHARASAGLFDVSHMGQIAISPRSGKLEDAALALERLVPVDILGIPSGRQRYAFFTNETGGILDDLMVANLGDRLHLVVNAANKSADLTYLSDRLSAVCEVRALDRALIALQGPRAAAALGQLLPDCTSLHFMGVRELEILGAPSVISRSGYTGEDGYEISLPTERAREFADRLLAIDGVGPIGLGARDSLRLEAGLCLHGADIDTTTTPVEAGITWAIQPSRRAGGVRAAGFPGSEIVLEQIAHGASRRRVGLKPEGRAPVRAGALLFAGANGGVPIGTVTSGGFGPTAAGPIAMGYVPLAHAAIGSRVFAEVRGQRLPTSVVSLPFVPHRYARR